MRILALDTSSNACSVALLCDNESRIRHEIVPRRHANHILSYIEEILDTERVSLDALAWGCGPGSFTGLRIAASVIQALGFVCQRPIINVSSLAALAQTAYQEHGWKQLAVAVDARMKEIYWGAYQINEEGYAELIQQEGLYSPQQLSTILKENLYVSTTWHGVGNAWSAYRSELDFYYKNKQNQQDVNCLPKALAVAQLGRLKYQKGEGLHSFDALPTYLRDNVCKIS